MNPYVSIILGAVAGYIFPYIIKIVLYPFKRFTKTAVCGKWFCYLWWDNGIEIDFAKMNVNINRGIMNDYKITCYDETTYFVGKCYIEDYNLCIEMKDTDAFRITSTYHRYELGTEDLKNSLYGFWLSFDANKKVSCGGAMLLRDELSNKTVEKIINDNFIIERDVPLLRLRH